MAGYLDAILAWIRLRCGDPDEARGLAGAWARAPASSRRTVVGLQARTVLAERAVRRGDDEADERLADVVADAGRTGELKRIGPVLELEVERALTVGDALPVERFAQVRAHLGPEPLRTGCFGARVAAWARVCGVPWVYSGAAPAPHAAMLQGDWQRAADAFGRAGWSHDRALLLSLLDSPGALAEALVIARQAGAAPLEQRVARRMRRLGLVVPRGPLRRTRSNPAQLTDRQREVLALVGEGAGNAEIADRLHLSPRTVEHHLAAILAKLGVPSRAAAVARAADLGLRGDGR